ncbi:MAG: hypothetical protein V1874_16245 [Spirochaetota bacterium]
MNIELTKEDREFLVLLLEREFKSALVEQHHTTHNDYKQVVKAKINELEALIVKMKKAA